MTRSEKSEKQASDAAEKKIADDIRCVYTVIRLAAIADSRFGHHMRHGFPGFPSDGRSETVSLSILGRIGFLSVETPEPCYKAMM